MRGCFALVASLAIMTCSASAAEVPLYQVYNQSGQVGVYNGGVGTLYNAGSGTISGVNIPGSASIAQAYLYWVGRNQPHNVITDDTLTFTRQGTPGSGITADTTYHVPFMKASNPSLPIWDANHTAFVADVTQHVAAGTFDYTISDLDMGREFGVGLQIVYEDASLPSQDIAIYQGHDFAFSDWMDGGELNRTWVLSHTFDPADEDRWLDATFLLAGAEANRPDQLWFLAGEHDGTNATLPSELITNSLGAVIDTDPLTASDGPEWDTLAKRVMIPAGSTYAAFQFQSGGGTATGLPVESFSWVSTSFAMVPEPSSLLLACFGGLGLLARRRCRL